MPVTITRLDLPREPVWLDLPLGVRVKVRPLDSALFAAATRMAAECQAESRPDWAGADAPQAVVEGIWTAELTTALAELAIMEWEGVQEPDGTATPCEPAEISWLMRAEWIIAQDFHRRYVLQGEALEQEGNGSISVPSGSSATGPNTAGTASRLPASAGTGSAATALDDSIPLA